MCLHLNELNIKLQGVNKTIIVTFDLIKEFQAKLQIFDRDVLTNTFKYFPNTKQIFAEEKPDQIKLTHEFPVVIQSTINKLSSRFKKQFRRFENTSKFILYPDTQSADDLNLEIFEWLNLKDIEM